MGKLSRRRNLTSATAIDIYNSTNSVSSHGFKIEQQSGDPTSQLMIQQQREQSRHAHTLTNKKNIKSIMTRNGTMLLVLLSVMLIVLLFTIVFVSSIPTMAEKYVQVLVPRKHTFSSYCFINGATTMVTRTILVAPPKNQYRNRQKLNYDPVNEATSSDLPTRSINCPEPGTDEYPSFPLEKYFSEDTERPCYAIHTITSASTSADDKNDAQATASGAATSISSSSNSNDRHMSGYQTCNNLHELELDGTSSKTAMKFISCGSSRCTFLVTIGGTDGGLSNEFVLKTTKLFVEIAVYRYRAAAKDTIALERLSSSPYTINMHASCALSRIIDYSRGGNLHDLFKRTRAAEQIGGGEPVWEQTLGSQQTLNDTSLNSTNATSNSSISNNETQFVSLSEEDRYLTPSRFQRHLFTTPLTKLKIAYQLTTAVADMHAVEDHPDGLPRMVHNDICCHQFVLVDGIYKLGDFDLTTFVTVREKAEQLTSNSSSVLTRGGLRGQQQPPQKQRVEEETCQKTPVWEGGHIKLLAPEQLPFYDESIERPSRIYRDKTDVFQLGNLCYSLLTNLYIWEGFLTTPALLATFHGARPPFPDDLWPMNATTTAALPSNADAAITSLKRAIQMAWTMDPLKRPSARAISNHLYATIAELDTRMPQDDVVRVENGVPPLPPNYRFTHSDFQKHRQTP